MPPHACTCARASTMQDQADSAIHWPGGPHDAEEGSPHTRHAVAAGHCRQRSQGVCIRI